MSLRCDQRRQRIEGWVFCCPPEQDEFTRCYVVFDLLKRLLVCYKRPSSASSLQGRQTSHENWPVLQQLDTDSISLVEECSRMKRQYCFAVHSLAKATYFSTETWKEMEEWMDCLQEGSRICVDKSSLNPNRQSIVGSYTTEIIGGNVIHTPVLQRVDEGNIASDIREDSLGSGSSDHQSSDSPSSMVLKSGYCVKQGAMMKNWKRRFLKLTPEEFMYSKNEMASKPLKRVPLTAVINVQVSQGELASIRSNLIEVETPDRTFYIQFDSIEEMYTWVEELRKACGLPVMTYL